MAFYAAAAKTVYRFRQPMIFSEGTSIAQIGIKRWLHGWALSRFAAYAANSPASRGNLLQSGVPSSRITTIPNPHDVQGGRRRLGDRASVRSALGVHSNETVVLCVCRLIRTKRVCDLVAAMRAPALSSCNVVLMIAGEGPERDRIRCLVNTLNLADRVRLLGTRADVPELLDAADIFVLPSEVEGLPNALIEAALAGIPIVASDIPGVRDVVEACSRVTLVPARRPEQLARAILAYHGCPPQARAQEAVRRQNALSRYCIDNVLGQLYGLYDTVCGRLDDSSWRHVTAR